MSQSTFASSDGGGRTTLPFQLMPQMADDMPPELTVRVIFYQFGENDTPWTGYYVIYNGARILVENYQGVWFQLKGTSQSTRAIHVVPERFGLVHQPLPNMNLTELRVQMAIHGASQILQTAITGFATTPTNPIDRPSCPSSRASSNTRIFGMGLNFGRGQSSSTPCTSR